MDARERILNEIAGDISRLSRVGVRRVAVDGMDGTGRTAFADDVARVLRGRGQRVIRAGADGFHHPPSIRHRAGRNSPMGYFRDSYDYKRLTEVLLDPLSPGGNRRFRRAVYDIANERPVSAPEEVADEGAVLVFDGVFGHRPQLLPYWDYSIYLDVDVEISVQRIAQRERSEPEAAAAARHRYAEGQRLYLRECAPRKRATIVIGYNDPVAPFVRRCFERQRGTGTRPVTASVVP